MIDMASTAAPPFSFAACGRKRKSIKYFPELIWSRQVLAARRPARESLKTNQSRAGDVVLVPRPARSF
jgi:hypothetical protein